MEAPAGEDKKPEEEVKTEEKDVKATPAKKVVKKGAKKGEGELDKSAEISSPEKAETKPAEEKKPEEADIKASPGKKVVKKVAKKGEGELEKVLILP